VLLQLDLLGQTGYRLTQPTHKWSDAGRELMNTVFCGHPRLKAAYDLAQKFRQWYAVENISRKDRPAIAADLHQWYGKVVGSGLDEFRSALKMIRKHEDEVINYFICGQISAKRKELTAKLIGLFPIKPLLVRFSQNSQVVFSSNTGLLIIGRLNINHKVLGECTKNTEKNERE